MFKKIRGKSSVEFILAIVFYVVAVATIAASLMLSAIFVKIL